MPTNQEMKELEVPETPVLLFECTFRDGFVERWSTHAITMSGNSFKAAILGHNLFEMRTLSEDGIDASARLNLTLANADSYYSQIGSSHDWKGGRLNVSFLFFDLVNNVPATQPIVVFRGVSNAPDTITESELRLTFNNRLNMQRVLLPAVRIQKRCPWMFPRTQEERQVAITGGAKGPYSGFFRCGYSAGEANGTGNLNAGLPFTSCDYTRSSCEERGMFSVDATSGVTRRFGGIEFVPASVLVRGYGDKQAHSSAVLDNEAKYNDFVPIVYGTAWYEPPVVLARNDGNLTRMEVLLGMGEIESVIKVLVNNVEIPAGQAGMNMTSTGWFNLINTGNRTGNFNLDFADGSGNPLGDPYGSMAYLSLVVPNRVSDGRSLPQVQVLIDGMKLDQYDSTGAFVRTGFTNNPAWVLLDVLRRSGWNLEELDLSGFKRSADYCNDLIDTKDLHGNSVNIARMQTNLVLRKRRSAAEIMRGIRTASGLFLTFGVDGKLSLNPESTLAQQSGAKPIGSNATETLNGGWPAYEFGDGSNGFSSILRKESGESSLRIFSRSTADAPNRFSVEFQDSFNEYQHDSFSLVDIEDSLATGQETTAMLPALGIPNFDQAARITKLQLLKSIKGNQYVEFGTSVRGFHLRPGDIITLTYLKQGLDRTPFRIARIAPGSNYRTAQITAQRHTDQWYLETSGDGANSNGRQPAYEIGLPKPLVGTILDSEGIPQFGVVEKVIETTDGGGTISLEVAYKKPRRVTSGAGIPILALAPIIETSNGSLSGNQTLYYAVTGNDNNGDESSLSFIVRARLSAATDTNAVTLNRLSFSSQTASFNVYRGVNPHQMFRIATDVVLGTTFRDIGLQSQLIGPPDENYATANFYWRLELEAARSTNIFSNTTIGNDTLSLISNVYKGKLVRIIKGKGAGQERLIAANDANALAVSELWFITPDTTSEFVVTEPTWIFAATTPVSPAVFEVPNRQGVTIEISGRSANANGKECAYELSPLTRWILGGASGLLRDTGIPEEPVFLLLTSGDGQVYLNSVAFSNLQNTHSVQSGTLTVYFTDELGGPWIHSIAEPVNEAVTTLVLNIPLSIEAGKLFQIDGEIMAAVELLNGGLGCIVTRGMFGTTPEAHTTGSTIYDLQSRVYVVPFARDFFGSPASSSFAYSMDLYNSRIAAAEFFVTNIRGNSPVAHQNFTATTDFGLRTLSGGQITIQVDGYLSIEDDAAPPLSIESNRAIRDLFAMVNEAPTGAPIILRVKQDTTELATLTIPINSTISNIVGGFGVIPLRQNSRLSLDIVSVGSSVNTTPGADLTVNVRF